MRRLIALVSVTGMTLLGLVGVTGPAQAKAPGPNGQIVFGRFDPAVGDQVVYAVNPDGSHLRQVIPGPSMSGECPHWSPDGSLIATCGTADGSATMLIDPDTGSFREIPLPDPTLFTPCFVWSPDAKRLACEAFSPTDPSRNGIYTIRTSDGRGLRRVTSNPNGDDNPGDYSPNGEQVAFGRTNPRRPNRANQAVFVVNIDGTGLKRITPWTHRACCGSWSPDGRWVLFAGGGALYVVHPNGTGLHQVRLQTGGSPYFATDAGWSPDGSMMVFSLFLPQNDALDVYTAHANGTHLVQVTTALVPNESQEGDELPDWGPHPLSP